MNNTKPTDWKKYLLVFLITGTIFVVAIYISNTISNKRIYEIKSIQDAVSTDILSSETQFSLLSELSCKEASNSLLSSEINDLGQKISYSESSSGSNTAEIIQLKKYYALLEIKDYLLMKRVSEKCGKKFMFALYFYDQGTKCPDCDKASYALTYLRQKYPDLRVYSFDYSLDLSAVSTLIKIFNISNVLPAIVIGDETINGFQEKEVLEKTLTAQYPAETKADLLKAVTSSSTATSTKKK
ncbi:MAG: hypothetical protein WCV55_02615 [Candidatus Paceibacterota bacterium]